MTKKNWVWVGIGVLIIVAIVVIGIVSTKDKKVSDGNTDPLKIGFIAPLSGDAAPYGEPLRDAVELLTKQTNANGGIRGRQIEVIYEDGKCEGKTASLAAQKLVTVDKVRAIIAGFCSSEALAAAQIAEQNGIILISPGASAPAFSDAGDYAFRVAPSDTASARKIVSLMAERGYKRVAIISEQTDYAQGMRKEFEKNTSEKGMELTYNDSFTSDTTDFKAIVPKINQSGAEAIMLNGQTGATTLRLAKALRDQGNKMQFYVYFMTGDDFVKSGASVEGTVVLDVDVVSNKGLYDKVFAEYKTAYNKVPTFALSVVAGYDATNILYKAFSSVGFDSAKVKSYLYQMPAYSGIMGNLTFDKNGDPLGNDVFVPRLIRGGVLVDYQK